MICVDEVIKTPFLGWYDSSAWLSKTWVDFHIAVATTEICHAPLHCTDIDCLVSVDIQQALMSVGIVFDRHGGIWSQTSVSYEHPHLRSLWQPVSLLLSHRCQPNLCSGFSMVETQLRCQQLWLMTFPEKNLKIRSHYFRSEPCNITETSSKNLKREKKKSLYWINTHSQNTLYDSFYPTW